MFLIIIVTYITKILISFPISVSKPQVDTNHLSLRLVTQVTGLKEREVVTHLSSDPQQSPPATGSLGPHLV